MTTMTHIAGLASAPIGWVILATQSRGKQGAIWSWWWLWLTLVLISIALVGIVAMIGRRRRMAGLLTGRPRKRRPIKDAWAEAGKRAVPLDPDEDSDDPEERRDMEEGGS